MHKKIFIIGEKRSIFTINLLGRIPRKWMGRYVYFDEVLPGCWKPVATLEAESDGRTLPLPTFNCDVAVYPFLHVFPCIFLGCDRVNLKVKMLFFPPNIKKYLSIFIHGLVWALGAPPRCVPLGSNAVRHSHFSREHSQNSYTDSQVVTPPLCRLGNDLQDQIINSHS